MEINGVEFEDEVDNDSQNKLGPAQNTPSGNWLISHKIVKSPLQANNILLVTLIICIVVGGIVLREGNKKPASPTAEQQLQFSQMVKVNQKTP